MLTFECPHCEQTYKLPPENAGKRTKCRNCGKAALVPDPDWVALADDEDGGEEVTPTPRPERLRVRAERARRRSTPA